MNNKKTGNAVTSPADLLIINLMSPNIVVN